MQYSIKSTVLAASAVAVGLAWAPSAQAQATAEGSADVKADVSLDDAGGDGSATDNSSAFLAAGKIGGIKPINDMGFFVHGAVELGWVFGGFNRRLAAMLEVGYTTPSAEGSKDDARLRYLDDAGAQQGGQYTWNYMLKELTFQPTFLYRFTGESSLVPYVGIGPRIYLIESIGEGEANGETLLVTTETNTNLGVGLPLGIEFLLGPGGLLAELQLQWGMLDDAIPGKNPMGLAAATLFIGYRAML